MFFIGVPAMGAPIFCGYRFVLLVERRKFFLKRKLILKGQKSMKRLKWYFNNMGNETASYTEIYNGEVKIPGVGKDGFIEEYIEEYYHDYYGGDIILRITATHKLAQDKPTLTWCIPAELLGIEDFTAAAADYCLRAFAPYIDELNAQLYNRSRPDNENGKYYLVKPGGEVLIRNSAYFAYCGQKDYVNLNGNIIKPLEDGIPRPPKMCLCICMQAQLPRRKLKKARQMLCSDLPGAIDMFVNEFNVSGLKEALELEKKQEAIREWLKSSEYCAFIANGSILPRSKGTDLPMAGAVPFISTPEDEIEACGVKGMGIKRGVTVITGGGYSGKSTLLDAISAGIYNHVKGDGRELCITDDSAVTISAEDGRSVKTVNISPFIKWLPGGDTVGFSTDRASGSTSQAANIMEAVDCGARLLLIDEDKSATNFMIRDKMMKELVAKEPITPFTDRVNELYEKCGVSTVLVIGGSGEYLSVADRIYMMEDFIIRDVTVKSKEICLEHGVCIDTASPCDWSQKRALSTEGFTSYPEGMGSERLEVIDLGIIIIGSETIDLRGVHDIVTPRQLYAIGFMLRYLMISNNDRIIDIAKRIDELYDKIESEGLDEMYSSYFTTTESFFDLPRKQEILATVNRMRRINIYK